MREKIIEGYNKVGIKVLGNQILQDFVDRIDIQHEQIGKHYRLFHMNLILDLLKIKEFDKHAFERYVKSLNDTSGRLNFWGEKLEIFMHSVLIRMTPSIIQDLRRGKDGVEPDLVFDYKNSIVGLELTTLKFTSKPKSKDEIIRKITDKILEKNGKCYASGKCALLIDVTNITFYEMLFGFNLGDIFETEFKGFGYLNKSFNFGKVILCDNVFKNNINEPTKHSWRPRIGLMNDSGAIDKDLMSFLKILFNNFRIDDIYYKAFHYANI